MPTPPPPSSNVVDCARRRVRRAYNAAAMSGQVFPFPNLDLDTRAVWVRVELSTILIKYAFKIAIQFWARRDNRVVPLA